jgi:hypothetical protein
MADFDKIVRPFQLKSFASPERVLLARKAVAPQVVTVGSNSSIKQGTFSYSLEGKYYQDLKFKETTRRN